MGEKPLTWQQVLIVFCVLALLPAALFAWAPNMPAEGRIWGLLGFILVLGLIVLLSISHVKKSNRKDLQPDVLAQLFPPQSVFQVGSMHFAAIGRQVDQWLQLTVVVQNLRDGEGDFSLKLSPEMRRYLQLAKSGGIFAEAIPEFFCTLSPASLILATLRIPFGAISKPAEIRLWLNANGSAKGNTVRFGRRRAATKRTSGFVTALGLLVGHVIAGGGTFLKLNFKPPVATEPARRDDATWPAGWQAVTLWTPEHRTPMPEMVAVLRQSI